jgi:hypothetical protein
MDGTGPEGCLGQASHIIIFCGIIWPQGFLWPFFVHVGLLFAAYLLKTSEIPYGFFISIYGIVTARRLLPA